MAHNNKERQEFMKILQQAGESLIHSLNQLPKEKHQGESIMRNQLSDDLSEPETDLDESSIFDKIPDFPIDQSIETKIINLKLTQFTHRRKDDVFKKHKSQQQRRIYIQRQQIEKQMPPHQPTAKLSKNEFHLNMNQGQEKVERFPFTMEDMDKLKQDTDLNDTVIGNYLKIFNFVFLPTEVENRCFFFSSFFMEKLISEFLKEEVVCSKEPSVLNAGVIKKVRESYKNVKRWTKKIDIFEREIVVVPINAFNHWFCIIILKSKYLLNPGAGKAEIIYCDSMIQKREFIVEAIRCYMQHQLEEKKSIKMELNEVNFPCYQLLLPRQTNCHDCGLYMLSYIEELITKPQNLDNLSQISNRRKLKLFPRTLIYTFRDRLRKLFWELINQEDSQKNNILAAYMGQRDRILREADPKDYDQIVEKEFRKYEKMNMWMFGGLSDEEKSFACEIKFYIDPDINFYEKDK